MGLEKVVLHLVKKICLLRNCHI